MRCSELVNVAILTQQMYLHALVSGDSISIKICSLLHKSIIKIIGIILIGVASIRANNTLLAGRSQN